MSTALMNPPQAETELRPMPSDPNDSARAPEKADEPAPPEAPEPFTPQRLAEWLRTCPLVPPGQSCGEVAVLLRQRKELECVVIADERQRPLGLVMKHRFFRYLSSQFGMALYGDKPITHLMDAAPLTVDQDMLPQELIDLAMSRSEETLYDAVVVKRDGKTAGILTISDLLNLSRLLQREASDRQIRTVRGTESMVRNILGAVERVSDAAVHSRHSSERIAEVADSGREELTQMLGLFRLWHDTANRQEASVAKLLERTKEAAGITRIISELADSCNLLAMNAQIEAARAGEHGRGFAVVAQEVRALADQTKQSTDRINRRLKDMAESAEQAAEAVREGKEGSDEGVRQVRKAETTFARLWEISSDNLEAAAKLTEASREASAISEQIRKQIDKLVSQLGGARAH